MLKKNISKGQKVTLSVNLDKFLVAELKKKAKHAGFSVSVLVNQAIKVLYMDDEEYFRQLKKMKWLEYKEAEYMEQECAALKVTR